MLSWFRNKRPHIPRSMIGRWGHRLIVEKYRVIEQPSGMGESDIFYESIEKVVHDDKSKVIVTTEDRSLEMYRVKETLRVVRRWVEYSNIRGGPSFNHVSTSCFDRTDRPRGRQQESSKTQKGTGMWGRIMKIAGLVVKVFGG